MRRSNLLALVLLVLSCETYAAAFALKEQGAAYLGTAFAGTASAAIDASTSYYNPAGLVRLPYDQLVFSGTYLQSNVKLYDASAVANGGAPVNNSGTTATPRGNAIIPGFALAKRFNSRLVLGLSVGAPFGLGLTYCDTDIARYMATKSKLTTMDISPSFGYKISNSWAVGAGFDAMYVKAWLNSAFNRSAAPTLNPALEGYVDNTASGWTYGYHLGIMFTPSSNVNMGLTYHSIFNPTVTGDVQTFNFVRPISAVTADVKLPDRITYGVTYVYSDTWTGMGEVEWTHWSRLKTLILNYNGGSSAREDLYYKNAWRFAFGVDYSYTQRLGFKGGFSFEQTPITDEHRTARLPDADRYWFTLGARYAVNKAIILDAAYGYVYFKNVPISQVGAGTDVRKRLNGNYKNYANVVGLQLTWNLV